MRTLGGLVLAMVLLIGACSGDDTDVDAGGPDGSTPGGEEPVPGAPDGRWTLVTVTVDGSTLARPDSADVDLTVDGDQIGGAAGCNSMGGRAEFGADGSLVLEDVVWTEMACADTDVMDFEQRYLGVLLGLAEWAADGDELVLRGPAGTLVFATRVAPPDAPIIGTSWQLDTFFDGEAATNAPEMDAVRLVFSDGGVSASGRCWTIDGFSTIEPDGEGNLSVDFSTADPGFSCDDRGLFSDVMDRLNAVSEYEVDGPRLTLGSADQPSMGFTSG